MRRFLHAKTTHGAPRSYRDAIQALNSLQSNAESIQRKIIEGRYINSVSIQDMRGWLSRIGHEPSRLNKLNVIHISGTKGKGSTCAFASSILNAFSKYDGFPSKVGMFTSPHLRAVRERIQINNRVISEELFAKYFFQVWDIIGDQPKPPYFRFLTLLAWHVFVELEVESVVLEVGIGGEYDCTNAIEQPTCVGITSLGLDHTAILGKTLKEIAWHKAGIIKQGRPVFTVQQPDEAMAVIQHRANEKQALLYVIDSTLASNMKLGISGEVQQQNASLAIAIVKEHFRVLGCLDEKIPFNEQKQVISGVASASCLGRCQVICYGCDTWYLDGAHTIESIQVATSWFEAARHEESSKILIFNQQTRDALTLLRVLRENSKTQFDHVIFCTNVTWKWGYEPGFLWFWLQLISDLSMAKDEGVATMEVQNRLRDEWERIDGGGQVRVEGTIEEAVDVVRGIGGRKEIFVCGSMHLIGGLMVVLEKVN